MIMWLPVFFRFHAVRVWKKLLERTFARKGILENKKRFAMTFSVLVLCAFLLPTENSYTICPREWVGIWQGNWGKTN